MTDYRTTVFLPKTDFPMKAGLAAKEQEILEFWQTIGLAATLQAQHQGTGTPFVLHDGPPYANGHLHIGHALNKILKDVINRQQRSIGRWVHYIPGWDCHGLPIEWKVEEEYRAAKKNKRDVPLLEFRRRCRDYAAGWLDVQRREFQRLGIDGDWAHPYTTMDYKAEAAIVSELHALLENGSLYAGFKPVLWSVWEETALAEAEVEYQDHTSTQVYVRLPILTGPDAVRGASVVIWTTTPWTLPANAAVACHADTAYAHVVVTGSAEGSLAIINERLLIAVERLEAAAETLGITYTILDTLPGAALVGSTLSPMWALAEQGMVPRTLHQADFVTTAQGSGFVHIAPAHGEDDFALHRAYPADVLLADFPQVVTGSGLYAAHTPILGGMHIFKPTTKQTILQTLQEAGKLLFAADFVHSYPHSWRSKKPLIYWATPQWFLAMDGANQTRAKALEEINERSFFPSGGQNRLKSMVQNRPDWCISRQRAWGVPIMVLCPRDTPGQPLCDKKVNEHIQKIVVAEGCDWWLDNPAAAASRVLEGTPYAAEDYTAVTDILDVWFDSGCTHRFVLRDPVNPAWPVRTDTPPADLYLEGSDQHRGWFQSSLLASVATRGHAPFRQILTHGFVLDEKGQKMSKSLGNVVAPETVIKDYGADILRLWVVGSDYYDDVRIGKNILTHTAERYRRLRNTFRYVLGALAGFTATEKVSDYSLLPPLEQYILGRLHLLDTQYKMLGNNYDFHDFYEMVHTFCANDLSAFYVDIRKDSVYCDAENALTRRAARTVMAEVLQHLMLWLAPVLCFTAEEVWQTARRDIPFFANKEESVHLLSWGALSLPPAPLNEDWEWLRRVRSVITAAIEQERAAKTLGSSLEAAVDIALENAPILPNLAALLKEISIVSRLTITDSISEPSFTLPSVPGVAVRITSLKDTPACARCWRHEDNGAQKLGTHANHPTLCVRCTAVVG